jgi:hypothetical protein
MVVALTVMVVLGACGKATDPPSVPSADGAGAPTGSASAEPSLSAEDRRVKFAQCMREHGVAMEDPGPGGGFRVGGEGADLDKAREAMQACREFAPGGNRGRPDPAQEERVRQFARCMREHGVEKFADPSSGRIMVDQEVTGDPDFAAAREVCQREFLPSLGAGPSLGPGR